jgi:hypothetical protein
MPIAFQDFAPAVTEKGFFNDTYEPLSATVARANAWIIAGGHRVVNVETVLLPNLRGDDTSETVRLRTSGEMGSEWHQIVRVWYEVPAQPA